MSLFSKKLIKTAAQKRSNIDLSSTVVTTNDFGFCLPIFSREAVPGDTFRIKLANLVRLESMPCPTFANIQIINRAFYVRYTDIWRPWGDFFAGRKYQQANGSLTQFDEVPSITNAQIVECFTDDAQEHMDHPFATLVDDSSLPYDFEVGQPGTQDPFRKFVFTHVGRKLYTLLCNLGYRINFTDLDETKFSMLPLIAYAKAYYDYVVPSRYSNDHPLRRFFEVERWDYGHSQSLLDEIANTFMSGYYDNDYFSASWTRPDMPDSDSYNIDTEISSPEQFLYGDYASVGIAGISKDAVQGAITNGDAINYWMMKSLEKLYQYGLRKGLAGNKYYESIFAQFGIRLPANANRRSQYLGSTISTVYIDDIPSNATTEVNGTITKLGDLAGFGKAQSSGQFINCDCNDFGQIIIFSTIIPATGYVQGRNRECMHLSRLDFFNPEFDQLGMQPIRNDELFADYKSNMDYSNGLNYGGRADGIFGYTPQYSEYKKGIDILSGDFNVPTLNTGLDSYHTFRLFEKPSQAYPLRNVEDFRKTDSSLNGNGFNRIFYLTDLSKDNFTCIFSVGCNVHRKMSSLMDSLDFEHDNGKTITVDGDKSV